MKELNLLDSIDLEQTLIGALGITFTQLDPDKVVCEMPVGPKTVQPMGLLHGGASVALAETAASIAAALNLNPETHYPVGLEINANHIRGKKDGVVTATAVPFHKGRTSMVWDIQITDEIGKLISVSRCTIAVVEKKVR
ncbi:MULTISPECIES: PaaI family thioesterase [unclassified Sporosarcina]|uniref:PaaI family thioesterase n=1 Tax=unclassified Sporosarcina TaxID=2647733 RepID=UPI0018ECB6A6|nr:MULTISPECIES: hotdog fold thioesterase [unclassified Sporosarcina]